MEREERCNQREEKQNHTECTCFFLLTSGRCSKSSGSSIDLYDASNEEDPWKLSDLDVNKCDPKHDKL